MILSKLKNFTIKYFNTTSCKKHHNSSKNFTDYFLDFKRVIMRKLIIGIADGRVVCDNKTVFEASDIRVGLFQD